MEVAKNDIITNFIKHKYNIAEESKDISDLLYKKICKYKLLIKYCDNNDNTYLYYNENMNPLIIITNKNNDFIFYFIEEDKSYTLTTQDN